jgi:hypothetical protein
VTAPDFETLKRELGRAVRSGLDAEVTLLLDQLGDRAVEALEQLEDSGRVMPQAWGVDQ